MSKLYIFDLETDKHIATITGDDNEGCEGKADDLNYHNDYYWTYLNPEIENYNSEAEQYSADTTNDYDFISQEKTLSYYAIGDLINGDTEIYCNYYKAERAYKEMFVEGVRCETENQDETELTDDEIQEKASDHFYIHKVTDYYDEYGDLDIELQEREDAWGPEKAIEIITVSSS
jgi:hypothetical protein